MRNTILAAVLLIFTACSHFRWGAPAETAEPAQQPAAEPAKPATEAAPAQGALATVEFASAAATKAGGKLTDTRYSERPDDAAITEKKFENGVVTYVGQVGFGKGSSYAGIGFWAPIQADESPVNLSAAKSVTFHVASPTTRTLRLRIAGAEKEIQSAGCYPVYMQAVTAEVKEYTIPVSSFAAEGWCAAKARTIPQTLPQVVGFEIADIAIQKAPTRFSVGTITVQ